MLRLQVNTGTGWSTLNTRSPGQRALGYSELSQVRNKWQASQLYSTAQFRIIDDEKVVDAALPATIPIAVPRPRPVSLKRPRVVRADVATDAQIAKGYQQAKETLKIKVLSSLKADP